MLFTGKLVIRFSRDMDFRPDWAVIRSLFRFGLPTGVQGIAMNLAGVMLLRYIGGLEQSAAAQAAYAIGYTELFSLITWTSVGLMGAAATVAGQNLGAGHPERAIQGVHAAAMIGLWVAGGVGLAFVAVPQVLLALFGATEAEVARLGEQLLRYLAVSGFFITVALTYTGGLQGTGDTRSPLFITLASQIAVPLGLCAAIEATRPLTAPDIWLAIVLGHLTRCVLTVLRFRQGRWRQIKVEIEGAHALAPSSPQPTTSPSRSSATTDAVCRAPPRSAAAERSESLIWSRLARARGAEVAARGHERVDRGNPRHHRRQGDSHRPDREGGDAAPARARAGHMAQGHPRSGPPGRRQRARGPPRMGQLAVRGPGRGVPAGGRAADHDMASDPERGHHAGPVEDRVPGGDRCRLGAR